MSTTEETLGPGRNLAMDLVRTTEAAAIAAVPHVGCGNKDEADGAAVEAMRTAIGRVPMRGVVIIGEGEKDKAPMLHNGEQVGDGSGPAIDIAVDPIDGTTLTSEGRGGAISVIAASEGGTMFNPGPMVYMDKVAIGYDANKGFDPEAPREIQIQHVADALGKKVSELMIAVLNRPRHKELVAQIRATGARVSLFSDGDVAMAIAAALPDTGIDMMVGVGGTPEGVIAAAALKCLGGGIYGQLYARPDTNDAQKAADEGYDLTELLTTDRLVSGNNCFFAATGITSGEFLQGVRYLDPAERSNGDTQVETHSVVYRSATGTIRQVPAIHNLSKMRGIGILV